MSNLTQTGIAIFSIACAMLPDLMDAYFANSRHSEHEQQITVRSQCLRQMQTCLRRYEFDTNLFQDLPLNLG